MWRHRQVLHFSIRRYMPLVNTGRKNRKRALLLQPLRIRINTQAVSALCSLGTRL